MLKFKAGYNYNEICIGHQKLWKLILCFLITFPRGSILKLKWWCISLDADMSEAYRDSWVVVSLCRRMAVCISVIRPLSPSTGIVNGTVQPSNFLNSQLQMCTYSGSIRQMTGMQTLAWWTHYLSFNRLHCQKHKTWLEIVFKMTVVNVGLTEI